MDLALTLGEAHKSSFSLLHNTRNNNKQPLTNNNTTNFCISLGKSSSEEEETRGGGGSSSELELLPSTPILPSSNHPSSHLRIPWLTDALGLERVAAVVPAAGVFDVNCFPVTPAAEDGDDGSGGSLSSPNSGVSCFPSRGGGGGSDEEENGGGGSTRKKLRLSKEQSAFLEESFKEHTTLNPRQKLALANRLNLRPRQVEVWFQNRRARTKLKQTEVDCEYLKKCCETLSEENRRLQKEVQELRALKTSQPFYMQLPATTLTMCPSCERVATNTTGGGGGAAAVNNEASALSLGSKPRMLSPFRNGPSPPATAGPEGPSDGFMVCL